ncbi:MAG: HAD-IC family P-type ATPase [Solirubrobacterales bacterium]
MNRRAPGASDAGDHADATNATTAVIDPNDTGEHGLDAAEARRRLEELGPTDPPGSRTVGSIVVGNVFTLFNAIIFVFFVLVLSLGLYADALFGFIAIVNTAIGIRQELKAKRVLDELAVLVAPRARVVRDGAETELGSQEVVPGDLVRLEPGDQLVADGPVAGARGLTLDESLLTGEAEGVRKAPGDRGLSGSYVLSGSGTYRLDAVREDAYAEQVAGQAREFRHPPSPLQREVDRILLATTGVMVPLAVVLLLSMRARDVPFEEAAQTATAGLITLVPEGLVLLMSVTLAVAAVRLARMRTLIQQMSATESLAAVNTLCVDKTGTLTDGELELVAVEPSPGVEDARLRHDLGRLAASAGTHNRTLETLASALPGTPDRPVAEVPFSSEWKWSGVSLAEPAGAQSLVLGAPEVLAGPGGMSLPEAVGRSVAHHQQAGDRVLVFADAAGTLDEDPSSPLPALRPLGLVVLREQLRPDAAETVAFVRSQDIDLKVISGDAPRTVETVARAVGVDVSQGVAHGGSLPDDDAGLLAAAHAHSVFARITPDQKRRLVAALAGDGRHVAMVGDGVNDVPALKAARLAVAMGSGSPVTRGVADIVLLDDQFSALPRSIGEGRRIARNIHRLARLYATKTVYAGALIAAVVPFGWTFPFLPRHLTVAALVTIGVPSFVLALAPSDGPLYRGRLLRALAAFAVPAGSAIALGSLLAFFLVDTVAGGTLQEGRTAATTALVILGLGFILLLERGPGREEMHVSSYVLALIAILGALFALILAAEPVRAFFELELLGAGQWFLVLASSAVSLLAAGAIWRLPVVRRLESEPVGGERESTDASVAAGATHRPVAADADEPTA